ncbi:hypothetical protein ACIOD2_00460 [Amycolatopsis sp. NPDC088138]|uniref:hypothetical protein n=1 Tax=Amycolatopsis sp. NPDC088138 TaxID=3363938 RepID=UPI00381C4649
MKAPKRGRRAARVLPAVAVVAASLAGCASPDRPSAGAAVPPDPVSRAEAESLLATAVSLAKQPNFCAVVAASEEQCRSEVAFAASAGWRPGDTPPRVTGVRQLPATVTGGSPVTVLELAGARADATPFTADFATARTDPDGDPQPHPGLLVRGRLPRPLSGSLHSGLGIAGAE